MAATDSQGNFLMFRDTLTELEHLVDVRGHVRWSSRPNFAVEEGIIHTLELLKGFDVNDCESNAIEELERLIEMENKIATQSRVMQCCRKEFRYGRAFEEIIGTKINFIKNGDFSRLGSKGGIEPLAVLKRLAVLKGKSDAAGMDDLVESKIREFVWRPRAKASCRNDLSLP